MWYLRECQFADSNLAMWLNPVALYNSTFYTFQISFTFQIAQMIAFFRAKTGISASVLVENYSRLRMCFCRPWPFSFHTPDP